MQERTLTEHQEASGVDRPAHLSAAFVKSVKASGRYGDGRGGYGLSLLVKDGSRGRVLKSWSQRLRVNGRAVNVGLGKYPIIGLADARERALENVTRVARGESLHGPARSSVPTFADTLETVIALHAPSWKTGAGTAEQWRASLRDYAIPVIGGMPLDRITSADVLRVLVPIWNDKRHLAQKIRQRIGAVMGWAIGQGYRPDNPAGDAITAALPRGGYKTRHHPALSHGDVAGALEAIDSVAGWPAAQWSMDLLVLTATRSGEARGARWEEIDLEAETWTIPAGRMKGGKVHRVPLSRQALKVLERARQLDKGNGLVFPTATGRMLPDDVLSGMLRQLNLACVPHGFRSSFRDWCGERGVAREVAEACLAHQVKNEVEAAYARSDLLERRRQVMQLWADYVTG
jgi:integrase